MVFKGLSILGLFDRYGPKKIRIRTDSYRLPVGNIWCTNQTSKLHLCFICNKQKKDLGRVKYKISDSTITIHEKIIQCSQLKATKLTIYRTEQLNSWTITFSMHLMMISAAPIMPNWKKAVKNIFTTKKREGLLW